MTVNTDPTAFQRWLTASRITASDYARWSGIHRNTIHRRCRGELATPKEVARLLTAAPEEIAAAVRRAQPLPHWPQP